MVLYEDNHLVFLAKPPGMPSQPDASGDPSALDWVKGYIRKRYNKPGEAFAGLVHRLDRPASGVMVFARTSKAAARLSAQFRDNSVSKRYLAVVCGAPPRKTGEAVDWLVKREQGNVAQRVPAGTRGAREARLRYRVLERAKGFCLVEVKIETGRHHQIRAQLAALGCPIVGDLKYGAPSPLPDRSIALHAARLELVHPVRKEPLVVEAPPPKSWPWNAFRSFSGAHDRLGP